MDQRTVAYRLDRKSSVRFYLRILFDLMDIPCVNSYLIYNMKHPNKLSFVDYKIAVAKNLILYHQDRKGAVSMLRSSQRKDQPQSIDNHAGHLPDYQMMQNDVLTVQWRVKKIEHSSFVWLVTLHYA